MTMNTEAVTWEEAFGTTPVPQSVIDTVAKSARSYEKRVVVALTNNSRIVNPDKTIRDFEDFKSDWRYDRSIHGTTDTCGVCNKQPIKENCVLVDDHTKEELIVGNVCVHRYIEITVDGEVLEGQKKKEYLAGRMSEARKKFKQEKWAHDYPAAMTDLLLFEPWMTERRSKRFADRNKFMDPTLASFHKAMTNRLTKHGFPGPKLWGQWDIFMETAHDRFRAWEKHLVVREAEAARRAEAERERRAAMAAKAAEMRDTWRTEAEEWRVKVINELGGFTSWESNMIVRVVNQWKVSGRPTKHGIGKFVQELDDRVLLAKGELELNDEAKEADTILRSVPLNDWECGFMVSIRQRLAIGRSLSDKQREIYDRIRAKAV
tara:strand:- start:7957 stop:9084 length:1128 start_codon:yes stop_codon:yes gene_type:complete